jgi:hypothetical protein
MLGSLENPPIIIRQDRLKLIVMAFACALFAVAAVLVAPSSRNSLVAYLFSAGFGLGFLLFIFMATNPGTLVLEPRGLTWKTWLRTFTRSWSDFSKFVAFTPPRSFATQPGCLFAETYRFGHVGARLMGGLVHWRSVGIEYC